MKHTINRGSLFLLVAGLMAVATACGSREATPAPTPAPTLAPTEASSLATGIAPTVQATATRVIYTDEGFAPGTVVVLQGETVEFVNQSEKPFWPASNIHPTHIIYPEFDAGQPVAPGKSWRFTFGRVGEWRYHNHLDTVQAGRIIVEGEAPATTRATSQKPREEFTFELPGSLSEAEVDLLYEDDQALTNFIRQYGPAAALEVLYQNQERLAIDCHSRAHELGHLAYEQFGAQAFSLSGHECQSGSYHGATEAFFHDYGTADLQNNISLICSDSLNAFFEHQCVHGVGHGIMAWTSYAMLDALDACDQLGKGVNRLSCYSGVFMENVVGGLSGSMGHFTEYLSEDPHYPCNILEERYVGPCYFYQTSRMVQLFAGDFQKVAEACDTAPRAVAYLCFESMGRDVGGYFRGNTELAIQSCSYTTTEENRHRCLSGAVQDWFWTPSTADVALGFCIALDDSGDKRVCYGTITQRARELPLDFTDFERFCAQIEEDYRRPLDGLGSLGEFPC